MKLPVLRNSNNRIQKIDCFHTWTGYNLIVSSVLVQYHVQIEQTFYVWIHSFGFELFIYYIRMRLCVCVFFCFFLVRWYKNIFTIEWFDVQCSGSIERKGTKSKMHVSFFKQQIYVIVIFDQFPLNSFLLWTQSICISIFGVQLSLLVIVCMYFFVFCCVSVGRMETFSRDWPYRFPISFSSFATEYKSNANRNETTKWRKDKIQMCYVLSL